MTDSPLRRSVASAKKVYVVMDHGWEWGDVKAVYVSEAAANEHVAEEERRRPITASGYPLRFNVEEYELRDTFDPATLEED